MPRKKLQWGRSGEGVEDVSAARTGSEPAALQWGRSGEGAEDARWLGWVPPEFVWLQWGRSGEGAEDIRASVSRPARRSLQWGRSGEGAEDGAVAVDQAVQNLASMGPLR